MPGLFARIFRRGKASTAGDSKDALMSKNASKNANGTSKADRRGRRHNKTSPAGGGADVPKSSAALARHTDRHTDRSSPTTSEDIAGQLMAPSSARVTTVSALSPAKSSELVPSLSPGGGSWGAGPDRSEGSSRVVLGSRNYPAPQQRRMGPVDLDDSEIDTDADENMVRRASPRLNSQHLLQLERQQPPQPMFTMDDEIPKNFFSAGQDVMSEGDESSSFNLSTDAEDTEYENLKRRGVLPTHLDNSSLSVKDYTTDGEHSVFPNLPTDDEGTASGVSVSYTTKDPVRKDPDTWTSPATSTKSNSAALTAVPNGDQQYRNYSLHSSSPATTAAPAPASHGAYPSYETSQHTAITATNRSHATSYSLDNNGSAEAGPRRDFVSPKTRDVRTTRNDFGFDDFADFSQADFDNNKRPDWAQASKVEEKHRRIHVETDKKNSPIRSHSSRQLTSSSTTDGRETSLPELLERAKSKSTKNRKGSSVNSAPALSASYLREHHGLAGRSGGASSSSRPYDAKITTDGNSSVSDIIKNLDAAAAARLHSRRSNDGVSSSHSRDNQSVRSAKDRLREHRRAREERRSRSNEDSSDSDENEASESWLFDEVTGALGPRGIAADLESLSGRSNRSHTSGGGRSHKSHRSHKSQRSSRRRPKNSSGESVGSQGSKRSHGSRLSRGSRYSHRSTRSYISQMSEQSRSVANDLLRLEMQLAMVGNSGDAGDRAQANTGPLGHPRTSSRSNHRSGGTGGSSSSRRMSSSSSRRSRVTVLAPPGKLGIILANKADSKGTVVSGVRTSSALVDKVSPGDRIVAIDGEDVSLMTVSEITSIMARKSDFERTLTVLTSPRHLSSTQLVSSPRASNEYDYKFRN
jgi:hypothetical protein